jgi:predicted SAM-dependent methyltransferase
MLSRQAKAAFYALAGPLMAANGVLYRTFRAPRAGGGTFRAHLGPGQRNYIGGWINVDANRFTGRCDVWADLRNPLPFHPDSLDAVYSHHVIEHLPNIEQHLQDVFRCLKPGGVYRVGGPHGDSAIRKFLENDREWFTDFPDKRVSIGGRFENFIFCRQEHLTILTYSYLEELLTRSGFVDIRSCMPTRETGAPELFAECLKIELEHDFETPHTLIVEACKPAGGTTPPSGRA